MERWLKMNCGWQTASGRRNYISSRLSNWLARSVNPSSWQSARNVQILKTIPTTRATRCLVPALHRSPHCEPVVSYLTRITPFRRARHDPIRSPSEPYRTRRPAWKGCISPALTRGRTLTSASTANSKHCCVSATSTLSRVVRFVASAMNGMCATQGCSRPLKRPCGLHAGGEPGFRKLAGAETTVIKMIRPRAEVPPPPTTRCAAGG
jgi:hypothetical protein